MSKEDIIIEKYGLCPDHSYHSEIKELLECEVATHNYNDGCGEYLRVLCFMIFYMGYVEDCVLIWRAKRLNMDTGSMIDVGLLCGGGYEQTIDFISMSPELKDMKEYLERCKLSGDEFDRDIIIENFKQYYRE